MYKYCPCCGSELIEPIDLSSIWLKFLQCKRCSQHYYLEVADMRNIYPLQLLELKVGRKLKSLTVEQISKIRSNLKMVDYKTVSIVEFEQMILNFNIEEN